MIEITFLGTISGIPTKERNHPAIVLEYYSWRKHTLLFDCGEGTQRQMMIAGISYMDIDKIFITHWHADHFAGLIPLLSTLNVEKRKRKLEIYAPQAKKFVKRILSLGYFPLRYEVKAINIPFKGKKMKKILEEKEFEIYSIPVCHTVPAVAYVFKEKDKWNIDLKKLKELGLKRGRWLKKIKEKGYAIVNGRKVRIEEIANLAKGIKVVYSGDTKPCKTIEIASKDADLLIHDATFFEEEKSKKTGHSDIIKACEIAKKANVKFLVLTHISRRYSEKIREIEKVAKEHFKNSVIAYDFMKIRIDKKGIKIVK